MRRILVAVALLAVLGGCASSHMEAGPVIDTANVAKIVKGKTTVAEIQTMFGNPFNTSLLGDGRRMAIYQSLRSDANAQVDPKVFIPIVGGFVATTTGHATYRQQMLQVIYTPDGVVQDYAFSDNTTNSTASVGALSGAQVQAVTTPTASAAPVSIQPVSTPTASSVSMPPASASNMATQTTPQSEQRVSCFRGDDGISHCLSE